MIPVADVCHEMLHRLRVKIPSKKGNASYFSTMRERMSECPGVKKVDVNPQTGSALIVHDCEAKTIFQYARKQGLFAREQTSRAHKPIFASVSDAFQSYDKSIRQMTGGEIDIPSLVFVGLMISGVYQIAKGNLVMPAWYTAFYYALQVFSKGHLDEPDAGENLIEDFEDIEGNGE